MILTKFSLLTFLGGMLQMLCGGNAKDLALLFNASGRNLRIAKLKDFLGKSNY